MRSFIAVDVSNKEVVQNIQSEIQSSERWGHDRVKPVDSKNLHFTLIFLGEVMEEKIESIKQKLSEIKFNPFSITYQEIGGFPSQSSAKVIWIGIDKEGANKLVNLANSVVSKMGEIGFLADKPFTPHITIFRVKAGSINLKDIASRYAGRSFGSDTIDRVHLKLSELRPTGPIYSNLFTVNAE